MRRYDDAYRPIHAREFLDRGDILHIAHPSAAILGGKNHAQQPQLAQFLDGCERKFRRLVPLHDIGLDLALGKLVHHLLQVQLFIVELKIQNPSGHFGGCGRRRPECAAQCSARSI